MRPRKKPQTIEQEQETISQVPALTEHDFEGHGEVIDDEVTALDEVLDELGEGSGGGKVNVYRLTVSKFGGGGTEKAFIDSFTIEEFSLDSLKSTYGAGRYRIMVYGSGGTGLKANKVIDIAAPLEVPAATSNVNSDLTAAMLEGFKQLGQLIVESRPVPVAAPSRIEMLEEMRLMSTMFQQPPPAQVAPVMNPLELFKMGAEMAASNNEDGSTPAWLGKMIDKFGDPLARMLEKGAANARVVSETSAAPAHRPAPTPAKKLNEKESDMQLLLKAYMVMVTKAASSGESPEEWANKILDQIPDENVEEVYALLKGDDWLEKLSSLAPKVKENSSWFGELRTITLQFIDEDRKNVTSASGETVLTNDESASSVPAHESTQPASTDTGQADIASESDVEVQDHNDTGRS